MVFSAFRDLKPGQQLIFGAFVILVSFLAFMLVGFLLAIPFFGIDAVMQLQNMDNLANSQKLNLLKFMQVIQAFGLFIIPPIILAYLYHGNSKNYLFLDKPINGASVVSVFIIMFVMTPLVALISEFNSNLSLPEWMSGVEGWMQNSENQAAEITEAFLHVKGFSGLAFNLFMVAVLPAIGEELLFRGIVQRIFVRITKNVHWGIWISAILFSAMHMQFYGFIPRMLLGALFGYLLVWSGSMWLPILGHFLNNGIAVVAAFLIHNKQLSPEVETYGSTSDSYFAAIVSLAIIVGLLLMIKRNNGGNIIQSETLTN